MEVGDGWFATTGTPADCVYLGVRHILKRKPDLIVSGINAGANLGTDVFYSGTVAAAREAALMGVKSVAFSLVDSPHATEKIAEQPMHFDDAAKIAVQAVEKLVGIELPKYSYINVNIPNVPQSEISGFRIARQGVRHYANDVTTRIDPRGKAYHWIGGNYVGFEPDPDCDCTALDQRWVSITPLSVDCTHNEAYATLKQRF
jgi:5'-nucleotidase